MSINIKRSAQQGMMMLEALMGLLIFSLGIMALMGMQATALINTMDAKARSDAGMLASQIQSKIWAAKANVNQYNYGVITSIPSGSELSEWGRNIVTSLPGAGNVDNGGNVTFTSGLEPELWAMSEILDQQELKIVIKWKHPGATNVRKYESSIWFDSFF